jgi:8-oxo-dGTP pyrophosphatase MutT (NUDIX family)
VTRRQRVVAYITRDTDHGRELLVFEDPKHMHMGLQVPAGRLEAEEELEAALLREIAEESGLENVRVVGELPDFENHYKNRYENHGFHVVVDGEGSDEWEHVVVGEGDDAGLTFYFRWVPIEDGLHLFERPHPLLSRLLEPIEQV